MAGQQPDLPAPSSSSPAPPPAAAERQNVASVINNFRVTSVVDRIRQHLNGTSNDAGSFVFYNLCLSLSRGIDYSVANNEVPYNPGELPELLKQVCSQKSDCISQAVYMVLLLSAKNACNCGWFSEKEVHELLTLTEEMARNFYSPTDVVIGSSDTISSASTIMTRFYPSFKLGQIFTSLDVKPGYGTHISDFHISKDLSYSGNEKIRLLVARTDNIETSACIISPQQVNFLVNGKAVERRTNCNMDPGPQLPTIVSAMLKYGTNLLQAVGQFDGPCIIIIAFMSVSKEHDHSSLLPYLPPNVIAPDTVPDSDLIEGPSRISLNCPISRTHIKLPVKGHSCKHLQCFDFSNFLEINLKIPSWRCPHCTRYVCYTDLRVDQTLAKIMEEVAEDIAEVIISADGSWKAVMESNDELTESLEGNLGRENNVNPVGSVVDLTEINDEMNITPVCGSVRTDERKLLNSDQLGNLIPANADTAWLEDSILVRSPSLSSRPSNFGLDVPAGSSLYQPDSAGVPPPPLTNIVSSQNGQSVASPSYLQAPQAQFLGASGRHAAVPMNSNASKSGYGNIPALRPRNMTPGATPSFSRPQALVSAPRNMSPGATQVLSRPQAPVSSPRSMTPGATQVFSRPQAPVSAPRNMTPGATQVFSRPQAPVSAPQRVRAMANESISNAYQNRPSLRPAAQLPQQRPLVFPSPTQPASPHRPSAGGFSNFRNPHLQQALNQLQSPSSRTHPTVVRQPSLHQRNIPTSIAPASHGAVPNPVHVQPQIRVPAPPNPSGSTPVSDSTPEQNFRPSGRMRGSLSGRPTDGLTHLIIQPTQLARPAGLPAGYSPNTEVSAPPHLQVQNLNPSHRNL